MEYTRNMVDYVKAFERDYGLEQDGILSPEDQVVLFGSWVRCIVIIVKEIHVQPSADTSHIYVFLVFCKRIGCSYPAGRWFESVLSHHKLTKQKCLVSSFLCSFAEIVFFLIALPRKPLVLPHIVPPPCVLEVKMRRTVSEYSSWIQEYFWNVKNIIIVWNDLEWYCVLF